MERERIKHNGEREKRDIMEGERKKETSSWRENET